MEATETKTATVYATKIVDPPSLDLVLAKERGTLSLKIARFQAWADEDVVHHAACEIEEIDFHNVRAIKLIADENVFSFEADRLFSYERSSYNRVSTQTERAAYRILVHRPRPNRDWKEGLWADLIQI